MQAAPCAASIDHGFDDTPARLTVRSRVHEGFFKVRCVRRRSLPRAVGPDKTSFIFARPFR
ncbi:hypothetical protein C7S13_8650 [Burkholderia cepacia]|nr:hypothetical protein [Burkholderia cepacia]MDW9246136.1 hypothetical protein [Burkholderia cepacia]